MGFSAPKNFSCDVGIDQACIFLESSQHEELQFDYQSLECEQCEFTHTVNFSKHGKEVRLDFVSLGTEWRVRHGDHTVCNGSQYFEEASSYILSTNKSLSYNGTIECVIKEHERGPSIFTPLYVAVAVYTLLAVLWLLGSLMYRKKLWKKLMKSQGTLNVSLANELTAAYSSSSFIDDRKQMQQKQRLRSLDTVRGIAIVIMIFVNYGGGKYWFFHHARWNGLTIADLVFPWFIWMMGMSMALSIRSLLRKEIPRQKIFLKILKRSFILFSLGLMLNTYCSEVDLKSLRISGVLQRFSISYFVVASIHLCFADAKDIPDESLLSWLSDIIPYLGEWSVMLLILAAHLLITFLLPVPNCPSGYIGPGGLHCGGNYSMCTGGAAGYIDRIVLGEKHLYQRPTFKAIYENHLPYDPEGILGYLTSIFLVYLGLQAGKIILIYHSPKRRVIHWLTWTAVTGILAAILTAGTKNDGWIPVNKNLWSVSYIFATGSMAFLLMSVCYMVIDVKKWWTGTPFYYAGMNSILLYVGHSITHNMFPWSWSVAATHGAKLALDLWGTTLWVLLAVWAYHVEFFVAV